MKNINFVWGGLIKESKKFPLPENLGELEHIKEAIHGDKTAIVYVRDGDRVEIGAGDYFRNNDMHRKGNLEDRGEMLYFLYAGPDSGVYENLNTFLKQVDSQIKPLDICTYNMLDSRHSTIEVIRNALKNPSPIDTYTERLIRDAEKCANTISPLEFLTAPNSDPIKIIMQMEQQSKKGKRVYLVDYNPQETTSDVIIRPNLTEKDRILQKGTLMYPIKPDGKLNKCLTKTITVSHSNSNEIRSKGVGLEVSRGIMDRLNGDMQLTGDISQLCRYMENPYYAP